jgi:ABC-type multidrug transport system permease subunit
MADPIHSSQRSTPSGPTNDEPSRSPLVELTRSRLREFWRDPAALFWVFCFPILLAAGLGVAFRNRPPDPVRVVVVVPVTAAPAGPTPSSSGDAARVAQVLEAAQGFVVERLPEADAALRLRRGQTDLLVLVDGPAATDSGTNDATAPKAAYTYRFDDTRPESRYARLAVDDALQRAAGRADTATTADARVTEPGSRYIDFLMPGLIGMNLLGGSMWGLGFGIVEQRKRKLLKRLAGTPMRRRDYLLSMLLSRLFFLVIEVVALVAIGRVAFGVAVQGSHVAVLAVCVLGGFAFTGLALLLAARPSSTEAASGWLNAAVMPMWILSGTFFSAARFPDWLQPIVQALPLTAMNDALRAVINEGQPLATQGGELAILAAWGTITFAIALRIFRWQ